MKTIYISRNGNQEGPYSEDEINSLLARNELSLNDYIWREGMSDWVAVSTVLSSAAKPDLEEFIPDNLVGKNQIPPKEMAESGSALKKSNIAETDYLMLIEEDAGDLHIYNDRVTITPKGVLSFLNRGFQGTKTIYFHSITGIQLKLAGAFAGGYLQFTIPGGNESKRGLLAAITDENSFLFREHNNLKAEQAKNLIELKMKESRDPKSGASFSLGDELSKLVDLKKQGILSDEEFQAAKKRLLS